MLKYKIDILEKLKENGYNTNRIRKEKIFSGTVMKMIYDGEIIGNKVLDRVCGILNLQPGDILEYVPDTEAEQVGEASEEE